MKNIAKLRAEKKLTQTKMAKMLGISVSSYNMYENGQRKIPQNKAIQIAKVLGVRIEDIFLPTAFTISKSGKKNNSA